MTLGNSESELRGTRLRESKYCHQESGLTVSRTRPHTNDLRPRSRRMSIAGAINGPRYDLWV